MRAFVCGLSLLSLIACARSNVPLGTEDSTAGGNPSNGNGDDAGNNGAPIDSGAETDSGANGMQVKDSGPVDMCPAATCASPMDVGEILSDVDGAPMMVQGTGHAFVKVLAADGQSTSNSAGGIRATLNSTGGNYDLFAYGGASDACADLSISSTNPAGQADSVAPIWGVNGPVVDVSWTLTFEVRPAAGQCDAGWTLNLEGNPCPMILAPSVPKQCP